MTQANKRLELIGVESLVGLTYKQWLKLDDEVTYKKFQLEEIARHLESRMRRRQLIRDRIFLRAYSKDVPEDSEKYYRWQKKMNDITAHDKFDSERWHAVMDRLHILLDTWNKMGAECDSKEI